MERMDETVIREIVIEVVSRLKAKKEGIIVGVSNRHLHLSSEDFESLFGPNRQLTKIKDLSQPGEFASAETVNLIGPKGTIRNVRVLGPFRENTQVEISKTDGFLLGVKTPVGESRKITGTPGIVIEGPNGKISKEKGLIVALRHVHMDPDYAKMHGVKNGDMVSVKTEGDRGLVFNNVLVRVSEKFRPEMHIDTDEANASDLKSGDYVVLEVMKEIVKSGKKALALFTGGTGGFEEAVQQVKNLREDGWSIDILFTAGAEKLYSKGYLQDKLEGFDLYFESEYTNHHFLGGICMVLIPVLTVNTAVKIALGISDTPATHLVSGALINGIPIVAAKDAGNPRNNRLDNLRSGIRSEAYARKLDSYVKTIEEYGVTLVACRDLSEAARSIGSRERGVDAGPKKRIITKEDIVSAKKDGSRKIFVDSNTKVTSYAEEIAGELGVEILCISQT